MFSVHIERPLDHYLYMYGGLSNGTILSNFIKYCKCAAHFSKCKMFSIILKFCFSLYTNSTCIFVVSACKLRHSIEEK